MKFLKKLILSSTILLLVGCNTMGPPTLLPEEKKVVINPEVMMDCGVLSESLPKGSTFEDTLIARAEDAKIFVACSKLNKSKKEIIQRYLLNERPQQTDTKPKDQTRRVGIFG